MCCIFSEICFSFKTERAIIPLNVSLLDTLHKLTVRWHPIHFSMPPQKKKGGHRRTLVLKSEPYVPNLF